MIPFLSAFSFGTSEIVELAVAALFLVALTIFFLKRRSFKLLLVYILVFALYVGVFFLNEIYRLPLLLMLSQLTAVFFVVVLIVVYQNDFKTLFFNMTRQRDGKRDEVKVSDEELKNTTEEIVRACTSMSKIRCGALIVIAPTNISPHILETGVELGALVSAPLLESIFNTKAQFHDGAVIVKGNRCLAAGCFLPLSQSKVIAKNLGTRHRAGIGITEETDMLTIIVSEENGIISVAQRGELKRYITPERLTDILYEIYNINGDTHKKGKNVI